MESGKRYVECMGGPDAVVAKAQAYFDQGDLRFAAELLNHVVFADPDHGAARELLAQTYDRLGWGAENGTWRNFYLMGAYELRHGIEAAALKTTGATDMISALSVEQLFDSIAIRIDGPRAWDEHLAIDWRFTDLGHTYRTELSNGVLVQDVDPADDLTPDLTMTAHQASVARTVGRRRHRRYRALRRSGNARAALGPRSRTGRGFRHRDPASLTTQNGPAQMRASAPVPSRRAAPLSHLAVSSSASSNCRSERGNCC